MMYADILTNIAAKELIKGLLKTNPAERFKIDEVLRHPWIAVSTYRLEY